MNSVSVSNKPAVVPRTDQRQEDPVESKADNSRRNWLGVPAIRGLIDRRILVNYRVDPVVLGALLPQPFRPKLIHGMGMVGICLIRLKHVRPRLLPKWIGISSENAAHRTAVEWDENNVVKQGVFVRRRDTNSWFNTAVGGRLFPGMHHHARFKTRETADRVEVSMCSDDGLTSLSVQGRVVGTLPESSVFRSLEEASKFFAHGSLGYSPSPRSGRFQGLELRCQDWRVEPLAVDEVRSSFFEDELLFPPGSIQFDCALLMRGIEHEWHSRGDLCCQTCSHRVPS